MSAATADNNSDAFRAHPSEDPMRIPLSRFAATTALTAITLCGLTACSGDSTTPTEKPSATNSASVVPGGTGTAKPGVLEVDEETGEYNVCVEDTAPFTGPATNTFGADEVMDAYCYLVARELGPDGFDSTLMRQEEGFSAEQFEAWTDRMNDAQRVRWGKAVEKAVAGDLEAVTTIWALTYYSVLRGSDYQFTDAPTTGVKSHSAATTDVEKGVNGQDVLILTFRITADLNVAKRSEPDVPLVLPLTKDVRFTLTPSGDKADPWFITDVVADHSVGEVRAS